MNDFGDLCIAAINNIKERTEFYKNGGFLKAVESNENVSSESVDGFVEMLKSYPKKDLDLLKSFLFSYYSNRDKDTLISNKFYSDCRGEAILESMTTIDLVLTSKKKSI